MSYASDALGLPHILLFIIGWLIIGLGPPKTDSVNTAMKDQVIFQLDRVIWLKYCNNIFSASSLKSKSNLSAYKCVSTNLLT